MAADFVPARHRRTGTSDQTSAEEKALQSQKLDEILGLLLGAGYFRARLPKLHPFDKVIGGLCWCILGSGAEVDADIFYDEDLALGQKIRIGENVIRALRSMDCPSPLQANQIQGSDFNAIFPVVQWLVKRVLENREATGDYVRASSETHFDRYYRDRFERSRVSLWAAGNGASPAGDSSPEAKAAAAAKEARQRDKSRRFLDTVLARYHPQRRFRRAAGLWEADDSLDPQARVQACLLEFGEKLDLGSRLKAGSSAPSGEDGDGASSATRPRRRSSAVAGRGGRRGSARRGSTSWDRQLATVEETAQQEAEKSEKEAAEREAEMLQQMQEGQGENVSGAAVGRLFGMQSDSLRRQAAQYAQKEAELRAEAASGDLLLNTRMGRAQGHARRVAKLRKRVTAETLRRDVALEELQGILAELKAVQRVMEDTERASEQIEREMENLEEQARRLGKHNEWMQLQRLLATHQTMLQQEKSFKATCNRQLQELQARLEKLRTRGETAGERERLKEAHRTFKEAERRHRRVRHMIGSRNREVQRLTRMIDDIPSRLELLQYERRFVELFDLVAAKTEEIRKYFAMYNTLHKKRGVLQKQESLLRSIRDQFSPAMQSKRSQQAFVQKCQELVQGMRQSLSNQQDEQVAREQARDAQSAAYHEVLEQQRAYFRAVKEFQTECDRNEELLARVEQRQGTSAAAAGGGHE